MELVDCFYQRDIPVIDPYTFVFTERDPVTGYWTMLGTSATGAAFSQWTSGCYELDGQNLHLGERVSFTERDLGKVLMNHVLSRMEE